MTAVGQSAPSRSSIQATIASLALFSSRSGKSGSVPERGYNMRPERRRRNRRGFAGSDRFARAPDGAVSYCLPMR